MPTGLIRWVSAPLRAARWSILFGLSGEVDVRQAVFARQALAELDAIGIRQTDVDNGEIERARGEMLARAGRVQRRRHLVPGHAQGLRDETRQRLVVLDDQDVLGGRLGAGHETGVPGRVTPRAPHGGA